ncbi:hypothetical protein N8877_00260, partial [bacterium]|nr:hypothetical protein [bacterium]
ENKPTEKNAPDLNSAEMQICEDSFASLRELFPPFELEEFCSCIFHSSAGFETFIESPGEYLKENEPCLKEYLFEPAEMTRADIKSYWKGVDRANQPVSKGDFAASCVKGVMPLLESSEAGYDEAYEFCLCIYDEADGKGLAMEELMADAGDDIANKCGHLIQP